MTIELVWGIGEGTTELNSFDVALKNAGIHNYNHIKLSSVIPKNESVELANTHTQKWDVGEFMATVMSEEVSSVSGKTISAGIGWAYAEEGGIFYEISGENQETVEYKIREGIKGGKEVRSDWNWDSEIHSKIVSHTVEDIGAVVVAAIYNPVSQNK